MIIIQALRSARTEYIVYFLLSAWLETLEHTGRARAMPAHSTRLPVRGAPDVDARLQAVRERLASGDGISPANERVLEDAAAALAVARDRLRELSRPEPARSHGKIRFSVSASRTPA